MLWAKQRTTIKTSGAGKHMIRLFKLLIFLAIIGFVGLVGYAYVGEYFGANFSPPQDEMRLPVTLDAE
ncbi:hypothetical protein RA29_15110 [Tateyamaria sp. ANG-S1]|nr:hypothetical protein RA29_15110 [Tateyamaria sp. ANG-S1]